MLNNTRLKQFKRKCLTSLLMLGLLVSCAQNPFEPNSGSPPLKQGFRDLQDAIDRDEATLISTVPNEVQDAMLPTLTPEPSVTSQARSKRFDISVNNMDARSFFMGLIKDTHYNMVVSPDVKGNITLDLKNVSIDGVLKAVHDMYGYEYEMTPYGYQVTADGLKTRLFTVDYLNLERISESEIRISSGEVNQNTNNNTDQSSGVNTQTQSNNTIPSAKIKTKITTNFWDTLKASLEAMLEGQPNRKIVLNPQAGLIMVHASNSELDKIAEYLDQMQNTMVRQVLLEAKILEVTLSDAYQQGIDWKILGAVQTGTADLVNPADITVQDTLKEFSNIFKLKASAGSQFSTVIELLTAQGNVQVLSSPRIATLNNQKAVIKVGFDEFFITNISNTSTTSSAATDNTQDIELTPFFSGIALDVTPQINSNGKVILHIHPLISNVYDQQKKFVVQNQATDIPMAFSVIRESDSIVEAQNGEVIVIGGLMEDRMEEFSGSTPFIDKLPFVGNFFRKTNQKSSKMELVILLKATVVDRNTWASNLKGQKNRYQDLERGYHFGGAYEVFGNMAEFPEK